MTTLISAEWIRLTSSRIWLWGGVAALASGAFIGLLALAGPENFDPPLPPLDTAEGTRVLVGLLGFLACLPALFGTAAVASEYRHGTVTTTSLFAPRRWTWLTAKLLAYTGAGLVYGFLAAAVAGAALFAAAAIDGVTLGLPVGVVLSLLARVALTMAVYTLLGVAIGALLRNQVAAMAVVGGYLYAVETALTMIPGVKALYPPARRGHGRVDRVHLPGRRRRRPDGRAGRPAPVRAGRWRGAGGLRAGRGGHRGPGTAAQRHHLRRARPSDQDDRTGSVSFLRPSQERPAVGLTSRTWPRGRSRRARPATPARARAGAGP
ncbi:hypothetical protein [Nonomuraea recticatena]|uniref:hypothetical protein n=1 Tax=Nonomuraea recticatena TaxID=46178 RepID=UPI0036175C70